MKRVVLLSAVLLAAMASGACGAPSSFDGVTGGSKEDESLAAPRQVSPISVSLVSTARPRFRWELGETLTGAVVELARTRAFEGEVKTFRAEGTELVVSEDLELGVWFWRVKGAARGAIGRTPSNVWELVVRGPAAHGSSDAPSRGLNDMDGNGIPDLVVAAGSIDGAAPTGGATQLTLPIGSSGPSATGTPAKPDAQVSPIVFFYRGSDSRSFAASLEPGYSAYSEVSYDGPFSMGAGTDFDGDGFPDLIESGSIIDPVRDGTSGSALLFSASIMYASKGEASGAFDLARSLPIVTDSFTTSLPTVHEAGDVDGDGFGDALVGLGDIGWLTLGAGSKDWAPPAILPLEQDISTPYDAPARAVLGGFDANGDGLADIAVGFTSQFMPTARAFWAAGDRRQRLSSSTMIEAPDTKRATAFAAGDFNGDGLDDIAMTSAVGVSSRVCIWLGDRTKTLVPGPCANAPGAEKAFGASLTAVDLEGDGVDELLATSTGDGVEAVRVLRVTGEDSVTVSAVGVSGMGARLATIWPGRPGKARWAAVAGDGTRGGIFEGERLVETRYPPTGITAFGRGIR